MDWNTIWADSVKGLFSVFFGSGSDNATRVIHLLQDTKWPALNASWFLVFWRNTFGLTIILAIAALLISIMTSVRYRNEVIFLNAVLDFIKTFVVGYFLLIILHLLMWVVDLIGQLFIFLGSIGYTGQWYDSLTALKTVEDLPGAAGLNIFTAISGKALVGETIVIQSSMLIFAIIYMVAFSFYRYGFGNLVFRAANSGLLVSLSSKLIILLILVVTSVLLRSQTAVGTDALGLFAVALFVCALMPIILFRNYMKGIRKMQIEGPVVTRSEGSNSRASFGRAQDRSYVGTIPEAGAGYERAAQRAKVVGGAATLAAVVFPEAAPVLLGVAKGAGHSASAARWKSGNVRQKDEARTAARNARNS